MTIDLGRLVPATAAALLAASLAGCGGSDDESLPQLAQATPAALSGNCADLATKISFPNTSITAATSVAAGSLTVAGTAVPAHCQRKSASSFPA